VGWAVCVGEERKNHGGGPRPTKAA